ncbi:hypothetical protein Rumal_1410 [Ruminococcus albus 7 = DSM 20455]|uniref:Uncharacterized protein n=1 Tax=Ruminococcus albus (strain ATCC 27210 / DSM 20455 / JCM 14654 / NCDO 2250 / 7) TaxID=697329 RepID=E6UFM0_RUMA7|nr:hypothetical protein Rumal_1410 [Ruminococcus albus 7 = DSM 20455]
MPRQKKDGVNINYFIRRDVKEKLDAYCEDVGQKAIIRLIQRNKTNHRFIVFFEKRCIIILNIISAVLRCVSYQLPDRST